MPAAPPACPMARGRPRTAASPSNSATGRSKPPGRAPGSAAAGPRRGIRLPRAVSAIMVWTSWALNAEGRHARPRMVAAVRVLSDRRGGPLVDHRHLRANADAPGADPPAGPVRREPLALAAAPIVQGRDAPVDAHREAPAVHGRGRRGAQPRGPERHDQPVRRLDVRARRAVSGGAASGRRDRPVLSMAARGAAGAWRRSAGLKW